MAKVNELRELRGKKMDEAEAIHAAAEAENRNFTEAETASFNEIRSAIKGLDERIERQVVLDHERAHAARATNGANPAITDVRDLNADRPYPFGDMLVDVRSAALNPSGNYTRLRAHQERELRALGLNESAPSEGGFLVGKDDLGGVITHAIESGQVLSRCTKIPIGPNANGLRANGIDETSRANGSRWGGVRGYWANEAGSVTATKPKFRKMNLDLEKVMAVYYATDEILQDTTALGAIATQAFGDELRFKVEDAIINGDGAGKPLGILNSAALVSQSRATSSTVKFADIVKVHGRFFAPARMGAVWFINQDVEEQLFQMFVPSTTVAAYLPPGGLSGSQYGTLFGKPVIPVEYCASMGTVGDVILANMGEYMVIDKGGAQNASSAHVAFLTDEMCFRFTYRVNGQPMWHSALTPFKGTNTQSPFVTIAT